MSIRWPYCREYQENPEYGRVDDYHEYYNAKTKQNERTPIYHAMHSCVVQDQIDMDNTVKKVCNVVFSILAIGALIGIGYAIGFKHNQ